MATTSHNASLLSLLPVLIFVSSVDSYFFPRKCIERHDASNLPFQITREDGLPLKLFIYVPDYAQQQIDRVTSFIDEIHNESGEFPWNDQQDMLDQFSYDLYALNRLEHYPHKVNSPEEADLVVVNWLISTDVLLGAKYSQYTSHSKLVTLEFASDPLILINVDKVVLFVDGARPRKLLRSQAPVLRVMHQVILIGQDHFRDHHVTSSRFITTPHSETPSLRNSFTCESIQNSNRSITTYFSGGHRVKDGATLRPSLEKQDWESIGGYFKLLRHQVEKTGAEALRESLESSYVSATLNSRFRLVIAGDGPSTRGLWDAMLGGSIPVIVSNKWLPHLPFPDIFDWKSLSVIVNSSSSANDMFEHIKKATNEFDDNNARAQISKLWPYFVWGWGSPSSRWNHGGAEQMMAATATA